MKKWLVTIAALWLAGCSSGEINKNYYQLPVVQSGTQSTASQGNRLLWVEQVTVPDYLAGNGVVSGADGGGRGGPATLCSRGF